MTVANNPSRDQYISTSGQTVFPYTFEIFDKDDVVVLKMGRLWLRVLTIRYRM
jgi:hypothetical protein